MLTENINRGRLSSELERLAGVNAELTQSVTDAKGKCSDLERRIEVFRKSEKDGVAVAAAREEILKAEKEQARAMVGRMNQSLAQVGCLRVS